jgi:hypothetical protein
MTNIFIVIAMLTISISGTICAPEFFGANEFLKSFITFELLNVLAVIVTVTLASIANIHLSLNRIVRSAFRDKRVGQARSAVVRREINQNGLLLAGLFFAACAALFLKGAQPNDIYVLSFVHSLGLTILLTNLLVLYDTYAVIYSLVKLEGQLPSSSDPNGSSSNSSEAV